MTTKESHIPNLSVLLRSYEALTNWRALVILSGSTLIAGVASVGGAAAIGHTGGIFVYGLMVLLAVGVFLVGLGGAATMLMAGIEAKPWPAIGDAVSEGLRAAPALLGAGIVLGLGFSALVLAVYVVSWFARIPGIGGLLGFFLAAPSVLVLAAGYAALSLAGPLAAVAIWRGDGWIEGLSRAVEIVLRRPLAVFMYFLVTGLVVLPAVLFFSGLVMAGTLTTGFMYATAHMSEVGGMGPFGALGAGMGPGAMMGMANLQGLGGAGLSIMLLWYLVMAVIWLIGLLGLILVFDEVAQGIGPGAETRLARRLKGEGS